MEIEDVAFGIYITFIITFICLLIYAVCSVCDWYDERYLNDNFSKQEIHQIKMARASGCYSRGYRTVIMPMRI